MSRGTGPKKKKKQVGRISHQPQHPQHQQQPPQNTLPTSGDPHKKIKNNQKIRPLKTKGATKKEKLEDNSESPVKTPKVQTKKAVQLQQTTIGNNLNVIGLVAGPPPRS